MPIDDQELGVFLFSQREYAEQFARSYADNPGGVLVAPIEIPDLARVLAEQAERGCTHVVTDPILGAARYHDQKTLTIDEYIARLPNG